MAKDPSFPFYYSDWLGSNHRAMMTLEEQGAYINLLCRQWADPTCSLPDDDATLARLSELGEQWMKGSSTTLRICFPKHPELASRIANPKLLELKAERDEWKAKCSEGGKKSGEVRRAKSNTATTSGKSGGAKGTSKTVQSKPRSKRELNANTPSSSPSSSPSSISSPLPSSIEEGFPDGKPCRAAPDRSVEIRAVFDHYRRYHPKAHRSPKSSMKEWGKIRARLEEGATVEDLCSAVDGIHKIPYNLGANERGTEYLSLELIVRDSSHVAKYMEADANPPRPVNEKERRTLDAAARFVERMANEPA